MENKTSVFGESLAKIKNALKAGDTQRLAALAGVSVETFRSAFKRANALELTEAEAKVINVCINDEVIRERINQANEIEKATRDLTGV